MFDNEFETKENEVLTKNKMLLNHNIYVFVTGQS